MCGIVGYVKKDCLSDIYNSLLSLEYRGYDSSGVAFFDNGMRVIKKKGMVSALLPYLKGYKADIGLGHTRWATHGEPSDKNSHPQVDGCFAIVHNGIIENYKQLKELSKGEYTSETDSEVIAKLLTRFYSGNTLQALFRVQELLKGSYAIAVLNENEPDKLFLLKKENPLIIGKGKDFYAFASDSPALIGQCSQLYKMQDGEVAVITNNSLELYKNKKKKSPTFYRTSLTKASINKGKYSCYMEKEIYEIPKTLKDTLADNPFSQLDKYIDFDINEIYLIGCGTAYNACLYAKHLIERKGVRCQAIVAGEFRYSNIPITKNTLIVAVSQSGETADTLGAIKKGKRKGAYVIGITNVPFSQITHLSSYIAITKAGAEIAVGATKSYNTQLLALKLLADKLGEINGITQSCTSKLYYYKKCKKVLDCDKVISQYIASNSFDNVFFIGRGIDYTTALEGALKAKEIACIHCDCCTASELKHGPLALLDSRTLVICIASERKLISKYENCLNEIRSRGAKILIISPFDLAYENVIKIPIMKSGFYGLVSVIPLQLFALRLAQKKGLNADKPRNLAKSVTVE